jgi:hypothetical protein
MGIPSKRSTFVLAKALSSVFFAWLHALKSNVKHRFAPKVSRFCQEKQHWSASWLESVGFLPVFDKSRV